MRKISIISAIISFMISILFFSILSPVAGIIVIIPLAMFCIDLKNIKKEKNQQKEELARIENELKSEKEQNEKDKIHAQENEQYLQSRIDELSAVAPVVDAEKEAAEIRENAEKEADEIRGKADEEAAKIVEEAKTATKDSREKLASADVEANRRLTSADVEAKRIIAEAEKKAQDIAGSAYDAMKRVHELEETETAIRNTINGYGDEWLKPTYSLLDELADEFSHTDAGAKLKDARKHTAAMIKTGIAANCEYVETLRRRTAITFVVDAFNGKVDSILSKTKKDNYGKLEREIQDAYHMVNLNGRAFKNARIMPEYLDARLEELKWAVVVHELRAKEIEEQRKIREQMREEARAQKEFERAQREAQREEAALQKAMAKVQGMLEKANEEERAKFEAQLAELETKLKEAEEKGQRALSMAQQTKHGNVYVISNVGSFGENIYKVGMTRRIEPLDRVRELGGASVPFQFDVHAIIESDDAPALEHALHQELALMQVNKVNPRKEFFKVDLVDIRALVEKRGLQAKWTMAAEAAEYRETIAIEERMKNDPDAQRKWEEFYGRISDDFDDDDAEQDNLA